VSKQDSLYPAGTPQEAEKLVQRHKGDQHRSTLEGMPGKMRVQPCFHGGQLANN